PTPPIASDVASELHSSPISTSPASATSTVAARAAVRARADGGRPGPVACNSGSWGGAAGALVAAGFTGWPHRGGGPAVAQASRAAALWPSAGGAGPASSCGPSALLVHQDQGGDRGGDDESLDRRDPGRRVQEE